MDKIIVEELVRSIAFFFIFYLLSILIGSLLFNSSSVSPYFILIPLILTLITFSLFVYKRKNTGKKYRLRRGGFEYRVMIAVGSVLCIFVVINGLYDVIIGDFLTGLFWVCLGIVAGVWGLTEIRRKS
ncbi:hypothetical protein E2P63_05645 [Candidatus Bathyarchaeota archaeon]|nr:hypothetical protein E2P63_05645 [Candidatus Bathyarchaeota archaeon]